MEYYTVVAERTDESWLLECEEAPEAESRVARLDRASDHMKTVISHVVGTPEDEIIIGLSVVMPEGARNLVNEAKEAHAETAKYRSRAAALTRAAARELYASNMTYREISIALGLSFQRAAQLVTDGAHKGAQPEAVGQQLSDGRTFIFEEAYRMERSEAQRQSVENAARAARGGRDASE